MNNRIQSDDANNSLTVSVVIPAYNSAATIERALNSVYFQAFQNIIEVIVIDDGSIDDTPAVVQQRFPNVRFVRQENAGPAAARNHGIRLATGDIVSFLDADDEWFPDHVAAQCAVAHKYPQCSLLCSRIMMHHSDDLVEVHPAVTLPGALAICTYRELVTGERQVPGNCSAWSVRRELFNEIGLFREDLSRLEDMEFIYRATRSGRLVFMLSAPSVRYQANSKEKLFSAFTLSKQATARAAILDSLIAVQPSPPLLTASERLSILRHWHAIIGDQFAMVGAEELSKEHFRKSLAVGGGNLGTKLRCWLGLNFPKYGAHRLWWARAMHKR